VSGGFAVLGFLVSVGLLAGGPVSVEALVACMSIDDDTARLACYDAQLSRQPSSGAAASPPSVSTKEAVAATVAPAPSAPVGQAPTAAAPAPAPVAPVSNPQDAFGLTAEQREARAAKSKEVAKVDRITATVVTAKMTVSGRLLLTLDNGQQWAQVEPSRQQYFYEGDPITIRKASLGSYLASGPKSGTGIRIKRIE
jgi:hypothetical protein